MCHCQPPPYLHLTESLSLSFSRSVPLLHTLLAHISVFAVQPVAQTVSYVWRPPHGGRQEGFMCAHGVLGPALFCPALTAGAVVVTRAGVVQRDCEVKFGDEVASYRRRRHRKETMKVGSASTAVTVLHLPSGLPGSCQVFCRRGRSAAATTNHSE